MKMMKIKFQTPIFSTTALFLFFGYTVYAQAEAPTILGTLKKNTTLFL